MHTQKKNLLFLKSALTEENPYIRTDKVKKWLHQRNQEVKVHVEKIQFKDLWKWDFHPVNGNLIHESGKFFSIEGVQVKTKLERTNEWKQPIINQPEVGLLGIITKEIDGILYFLMQAKIEPGNVNHVQLSPTLQATRSNYTQVHQGKKPLYLDYFLDRSKSQILLDQLQSEQGARFFRKRNRNIIIQIDDDITVFDDFCWLTLGQIKKLIHSDNTINMDTRTVISGIPYGNYQAEVVDFYNSMVNGKSADNQFNSGMLKSVLDCEDSLFSFDEILSWLAQLKSKYELWTEKIPLNAVDRWLKDDYCIHHEDNKYFKVIAVAVEINNREVQQWTQPLIEPAQEGICAFIVKKIKGIYHFLVQAKLECGNMDILELAPTVQCLTGNYRDSRKPELPFLEYVLNAENKQARYCCYQSEEGGRFYREQNKNIIIEADENFPVQEIPKNYTWLTLNQLLAFLKFNNYLNIQARSLISAIHFM